MAGIKVGDTAPDFRAQGTGDREYALSDYKASSVVLVFYPGDSTPTCTEQLQGYSASFGEFENLGAAVLAISPQNIESHEAFAAEHSFPFPLLYDDNKRIGHEYGVVGPLGFYRRSIFVIDGEGVVRYAKRYLAGLSYAKSDELLAVLKDLAQSSN